MYIPIIVLGKTRRQFDPYLQAHKVELTNRLYCAKNNKAIFKRIDVETPLDR